MRGPEALEIFRAAQNVAEALNLWHKGGAATGDVAFWVPHAEMLDAPKSYVLIVDTLLEHSDYVTSSALLMHWLSQSDSVPLERGSCSFHRQAQQWMQSICQQPRTKRADAEALWPMIRRFFDQMEANAEQFWEVPEFSLSRANSREPDDDSIDSSEEDDPDSDQLFSAAYENVVYHDSTGRRRGWRHL